jgi:hypothetical protein
MSSNLYEKNKCSYTSNDIILSDTCILYGCNIPPENNVLPCRQVQDSIHVQWSLINPYAINPDASLSGQFFWEQNIKQIYHV